MEKGDRHLNQWVEDRIARLEAPPAWSPDANRGLAGVYRKSRSVRRRRWGLSVATLAALASALFTIPGCQASTCKVQSENLAERLWKSVFVPEPAKPQPAPAPLLPPAPPAPAPTAPESVRPAKRAAARRNFKESGSPDAPVTCEIYTDYECPACARFYLEVVPQINAEYVATGKVKLLHRDFPLSAHRYSRLAARYANAAGLAGEYDVAVTQLFRTQAAWGLSGDIDTQLAQILAPDVMAKVRDLVHSDSHLDDTVMTDLDQGRTDQLSRTPSVVVVFNGERRVIGTSDYEILRQTLDRLLTP